MGRAWQALGSSLWLPGCLSGPWTRLLPAQASTVAPRVPGPNARGNFPPARLCHRLCGLKPGLGRASPSGTWGRAPRLSWATSHRGGQLALFHGSQQGLSFSFRKMWEPKWGGETYLGDQSAQVIRLNPCPAQNGVLRHQESNGRARGHRGRWPPSRDADLSHTAPSTPLPLSHTGFAGASQPTTPPQRGKQLWSPPLPFRVPPSPGNA